MSRCLWTILLAAGLLISLPDARPLLAQSDPSTPEALFAKAYEHSVKGELEEALPLYEELIRQLPADPKVLYNAGSADLRAGHLGKAVLYLERAVSLEPDCADCVYNLNKARELQQDRVIGEQKSAADAVSTDTLMDSLSEAGLAIAFLIAHILLALLMLARRLTRQERSRFAVSLMLAIALAVDLGLGGLLALKVYGYEARPRAVVMDAELAVRKGPNPNYPEAFTVHEGLVLRLGERVEDWRQVWLDNGLNGYVPSASLAAIDPKIAP
jgi:tetratricopeptide (TPR) repeat protein